MRKLWFHQYWEGMGGAMNRLITEDKGQNGENYKGMEEHS